MAEMRKRTIWTDADLEYLKANFADMKAADIAKHLNKTLSSIYHRAHLLKLKKSEAFWASEASGRLNKNSGVRHRFKKGHDSWNKGKRMPGTCSFTSFKKGNVPHNTKEDGFISVRNCKGYNYKWIRVANGKWEMLHRELWRKHVGEIPAGGVIRFKDGNTLNCELSNLYLVDNNENMRLNSIHRYPEEVKDVIRTISNLKRKIQKHVEEQTN